MCVLCRIKYKHSAVASPSRTVPRWGATVRCGSVYHQAAAYMRCGSVYLQAFPYVRCGSVYLQAFAYMLSGSVYLQVWCHLATAVTLAVSTFTPRTGRQAFNIVLLITGWSRLAFFFWGGQLMQEPNLGSAKSCFLIGFRPLIFRHSPCTLSFFTKKKKKKNASPPDPCLS